VGTERLDLEDRLGPPAGWSRHAADWGMASLLTGGVVLVMTPLLMVVIALGVLVAFNAWNEKELSTAALLVSIPVIALVVLAVMGLAFGLVGLISAWSRKLPSGLPAAGMTVSAVSALFAVILLVGTFLITDDLKKMKSQGMRLKFGMSAQEQLRTL
jgi:hypothetical protein